MNSRFASGRIWALPLCALLLLTLIGASKPKPSDAATRAAIEGVNKKLAAALARADGAAVAALYTADAQLFPPNSEIVSGRAAVQAFWQATAEAGVKEMKLETLEVEGAAGMAWEAGKYTVFGEGGAPLDSGKYIVLWRQEKGEWRLHRDIWNSSLPEKKPTAGN